MRHGVAAAAISASIALGVLGAPALAAGSPGRLPHTPHGLERARDHYSAPGEVTRFEGPGPGGSRLSVISALGTNHVTCIKLVITDRPAFRSRSVPGVCSPPSRKGRVFYAFWTYRWKTPSGHTYRIYFGDASTTVERLGTGAVPASVVVSGSSGSKGATSRLASVKLQRGWFAVGFTVPHDDRYSITASSGSGRSLLVLASQR